MSKWRLTFVLCLCSLGSALAQLSPLEQSVIGVWHFPGRNPGRITLRADHTCATMLPIAGGSGWEILAKGTWRIERDYLIRVEKPVFGPSASVRPAGPSVTSKLRIRSVTPDRFRLGAGLPLKRVE
jgi:hypothetical protein